MKTFAGLAIVLAALLSPAAYSCDEKCLRETAQSVNNVKFPSYLSWSSCEQTRLGFMEFFVRSLDEYRTKHFGIKYKGGMETTRQQIAQQKEWLQECDTYMKLTKKGRIFDDKRTTDDIFAKLDAISKELEDLIAGVTYSTSFGEDSTVVMNEKFESLFKAVDDHKTLMHLKGKYVYR